MLLTRLLSQQKKVECLLLLQEGSDRTRVGKVYISSWPELKPATTLIN